jgi:hypothetical protein
MWEDSCKSLHKLYILIVYNALCPACDDVTISTPTPWTAKCRVTVIKSPLLKTKDMTTCRAVKAQHRVGNRHVRVCACVRACVCVQQRLNDDYREKLKISLKTKLSWGHMLVSGQWHFQAEGQERVTCTALETADWRTKQNNFPPLAPHARSGLVGQLRLVLHGPETNKWPIHCHHISARIKPDIRHWKEFTITNVSK